MEWKLFWPMSIPRVATCRSGAVGMAQILVLCAPDEGCAGKHGQPIPLADLQHLRLPPSGCPRSPLNMIVDASWQGLEKVWDDYLGLLLINSVALAKNTVEQCLLCSGAPHEGRDNPEQHNGKSRQAAEGEGFARSK